MAASNKPVCKCPSYYAVEDAALSDFCPVHGLEEFRRPPPEIDICSQCKDHNADWWWDDTEWLSACCSARPVETDPS